MLRRLGGGLLAALVFVLLLEAGLRWLDPIGTMTYARTLGWTHTVRLPAHSGYIHTPGVYRVSGQPVAIGLDGLRITPPQQDAACTVAVLGDSVAFGLGVGDRDTFVWRLAEQFEAVRWINTARTGYNAANLMRVLDEHTPDGWLYYAVSNDAGPPTEAVNIATRPTALTLHWRVMTAIVNDRQGNVAPSPAAWRDLDALVMRLQQHNALIVGADGHAVTAYLVERDAGVRIPAHNQPINAVDPHPNADGHAHIANMLTPLVADWLPTVCDS